MKVVHVIEVAGLVGGAQTALHQTATLLRDAGHDVAVLHGDPHGSAPEGVTHAAYDRRDLRSWVEDLRPDVAHIHGPSAPPGVLGALENVPVVWDLHNFAFACASGHKYFRDGVICERSHGPGCITAAAYRGCAHRLDPRPFVARYRQIASELGSLRAARAVIVHSEYMRRVAVAAGVPEPIVRVVPYSVPRESVMSAPMSARTLVFAGRLVPEKGADVLLRAAARCSQLWDSLRVAGEGWDRDRCERVARAAGLEDRVDFMGHVSASGTRRLFESARIVVVPSRWPEPFGLVGPEGMACGRAVVASDVGGIPEWLDDGETGRLVPPGDVDALADALAELLSDPVRTDAMGREGWMRVTRFSPQNHVDGLLAAYQRAARSSTAVA